MLLRKTGHTSTSPVWCPLALQPCRRHLVHQIPSSSAMSSSFSALPCSSSYVLAKRCGGKQSRDFPSLDLDFKSSYMSANTIKQQRSRAMHMRYFWLLCHQAQKMSKISYHSRQENLGDYASKYHTGAYHRRVGPFYLHTDQYFRLLPRAAQPSERQGCVRTRDTPYVSRTSLPMRIIPA